MNLKGDRFGGKWMDQAKDRAQLFAFMWAVLNLGVLLPQCYIFIIYLLLCFAVLEQSHLTIYKYMC
jgi:hypothetical protein